MKDFIETHYGKLVAFVSGYLAQILAVLGIGG